MVSIKRQIVPKSIASKVTYGGKSQIKSITVHQTGNTNKGANAQVHANLQSNGNSRAASWHYQVDDIQAVQSFEDTAQCWHAGDGRGNGNLHSIGVEICINSDGDYKKAIENGAELVKHLLDKHNLKISDVKQHHDWSGKNCPAQIRANKDGINWSDFIKMVQGTSLSTAKKANPSIRTGGLNPENLAKTSNWLRDKGWYWTAVGSKGNNPTVRTGGLNKSMQKEFGDWLDNQGFWYTIESN